MPLFRYFAALCAFALAGCISGEPDGEIATYTIQPYLVPCGIIGSTRCMAQAAPDSGSGFPPEGIEGFEFAWGFRATVKVAKYRVPNPPADRDQIKSVRYDRGVILRISPASDSLLQGLVVMRGD